MESKLEILIHSVQLRRSIHIYVYTNQNNRISPNGRGVPNFYLQGTPSAPEILSNKIILTPPTPGNQRGAAWGETVVDLPVWTVDVDFRATGPERGGGNFNLWYVKEGQGRVGTSSIYTVGKFDGLAIVVDTYGGSVSQHGL